MSVDGKKYFLSIQSGTFLGNIISADPQLEFMYMSLVSVSSDFESGIDSQRWKKMNKNAVHSRSVQFSS